MKKSLLSILLCALLITAFTACAKSGTDSEKTKADTSTTAENSSTTEAAAAAATNSKPIKTSANTVSAECSYVKLYKSAEELISDETIPVFVTVKVIETKTVIVDRYVFTKVSAEIKDVLKGSDKVNGAIEFMEPGGYVTAEEAKLITDSKISDNNNSPEGLFYDYSGYKCAEIGDEIAVFLTESTDESIKALFGSDTIYSVAGGVQGKFVLTDSVYVNASDEDSFIGSLGDYSTVKALADKAF